MAARTPLSIYLCAVNTVQIIQKVPFYDVV